MQFSSQNQSIKIPKILYGTAWKKDHTANLVLQALDVGFRGIDTACQPKHYNEAGVGEAINKSMIKREELFIQTKFTPVTGQDPHTIPYNPAMSLDEQVADSFEISKSNLQTDYVDSLLIHSPLFPYTNMLTVWRAMEKIAQNQEAKHIGVSNCYDLKLLQRLYQDAQIKPKIVQNRFYRDSDYDIELRKWCIEHDITYQSFWSLTANPHLLHHHIITALTIKYDKTPEQIFFSYLMSQHIVPLSGTTSSSHMKEDLMVDGNWMEDPEYTSITALLL